MDWGKHISESSSNATKAFDFFRRNLAFAPWSTKEVAYKTLVHSKLEYAAPFWSPYSILHINQIGKFRVQRPTGPADGEKRVVSAKCLMNLNGHLLRPVGISPTCFSFIRFIVEQCLLKKNKYITHAHSLKTTRSSHSAQYCRYQTYSAALKTLVTPNYSTLEYPVSFCDQYPQRSFGHSSSSQNIAKSLPLFFFGGGGGGLQNRTPWHNVSNGASQ